MAVVAKYGRRGWRLDLVPPGVGPRVETPGATDTDAYQAPPSLAQYPGPL